jgi:RepB plasmid partitioning protein/ParB-like nuclease domain
MSEAVRLACESEVVTIPIANILPLRKLDAGIKMTVKYKCIEASIKELGLIEPLMVYKQPDGTGLYMLLDGHVRHLAVKTLGFPTAKCLIALDDEAFTYNHKVSRLSTIQEHFMIRRALKNGVCEERIARSLNVDIGTIRRKRDLLNGICPEAVELLKDRRATDGVFRELRKVKPMRQIEIAELMRAAGNCTVTYVKCLVAASGMEQTVEGNRPKELQSLSPEDVSRMEHEMVQLSRDFRAIEESHGKNTLHLVIVTAYLRKLLDNARIVRFMLQNNRRFSPNFKSLWITGRYRKPLPRSNVTAFLRVEVSPGRASTREMQSSDQGLAPAGKVTFEAAGRSWHAIQKWSSPFEMHSTNQQAQVYPKY